MFDLGVPFFLPFWRRVAVVAVSAGWALVELSSGQFFWAIVFAGIAGFATYQFYVTDWSAVTADKDG